MRWPASVGIHRIAGDGDLTLETCLPVAAAMLRSEAMEEAEQTRQRDALLRGFDYLFVDEYQDIDAAKYELLSAIAGRAMEGDQRKLRVFAVGDDDQAIYAWDGASNDFIRSFEQDYHATRFVVPHSYRNPKVKPVLDRAVDLILDSKRSLGIMVGNVGAAQHWKQRGARFITITLDNITGPAIRAYLNTVRSS
jgi:hypothetical protein